MPVILRPGSHPTWMEAGFNVVVNGSCAYLSEAARRYPDLRPVRISVEPGILRHRLQVRGRENESEIKHRLALAEAYEVLHPRLVVIDNSGELALAGNTLFSLVRDVGAALKKTV